MYKQLLQLDEVMRFCISWGDTHQFLMFVLKSDFW